MLLSLDSIKKMSKLFYLEGLHVKGIVTQIEKLEIQIILKIGCLKNFLDVRN